MSTTDFKDIRDQLARLVSHFDSESRAREHLKDRAANIEKTLIRIEEKMSQYDKVIYNGGTRIDVKVDRLEQANKHSRFTWERIFLIINIIGMLALAAIEIFNK